MLPEFVTPAAIASMAAEANALAHTAFCSSSVHDVFLAPPHEGTINASQCHSPVIYF